MSLEDLDLFLGGAPLTSGGDRSVERAVLHQEEVAFQLHLDAGHGFELSPSVGLAHFGYWSRSREGDTDRGGSAFLRAGLIARWFYKRFFVGVDAGWCPVELVRYELVPGRRDDELRAERLPVRDAFDARRVTAALQVGLSL